MNKFYLNDGQLSAYSFACGYVQEAKGKEYYIKMYSESVVHVKVFANDSTRLEWNSYDTIGEARKAFRALCKKYNCKLVKPTPKNNSK